MKKILLILIPLLIWGNLFGQTSPPPPVSSSPSSNELFGNSQNNIIGAQSKSFGGGSIIKPNPMLTSADFALIQNPTYEDGWRYGTSLGWSKIKNEKGFGVNAVLTFDLTQQSYSSYYKNKDLYYHFNFGKMGTTINLGGSVTKMFLTDKINFGIQIGSSVLEDHKYVYFILVPYTVLMANKEIKLSNKIKWTPETFITLCSPYYDLGLGTLGDSTTFNSVVGNSLSVNVSKWFKMNINWRMNINTTPKFGIMNNVLIGGNLDF
jgi:hypothetical protein